MSLWNPLSWFSELAKAVSEPVTAWVKGREERLTTKAASEAKVAETKAQALLEAARTGNTIAIQESKGALDWDQEALRQSQFSWKDEYLLILFTLPVICAFIPGLAGYVERGFEVISGMPVWYRWCLLGMVAAAFGLRWIIAPLLGRQAKA
ncbi:hypothetical protein [Desulfocurvus sp. DL9XJH121]